MWTSISGRRSGVNQASGDAEKIDMDVAPPRSRIDPIDRESLSLEGKRFRHTSVRSFSHFMIAICGRPSKSIPSTIASPTAALMTAPNLVSATTTARQLIDDEQYILLRIQTDYVPSELACVAVLQQLQLCQGGSRRGSLSARGLCTHG